MNQPRIYTCQEWGAQPPAHSFAQTRPQKIIVHHMDYPNRPLESDPAQACRIAFELARACQRDHMHNNGWADTGQSFTISRDGIICEGRHGALQAARLGHNVRSAHAADGRIDDNDDFGIENEGTYTSAAMPKKQWDALVSLCAWLAFQCNIDTAQILGHRDTGIATACPGAWLEAQLPTLRQQAHTLKLAGGKD